MAGAQPEADQALVPLKELGGTGPDTLLIHGFGSDRLSWLANSPVLQQSMRVWALDLPGHGSARMQVGDGSVGYLTSAVAEAIADRGLRDLALVGHSLGGGVASLLAATRPDLVRALVLIAPPGLGKGVDDVFLDALPKLESKEQTEALLQRLVSRPRLINKQLVALVQRQLAIPHARDALASVAEGIRRSGPLLKEALDAVARADVPRLVVWGEADAINPPDPAALDAFGGRLLMVPEAGHLPHVEAASLVNTTILEFLRDKSSDPEAH